MAQHIANFILVAFVPIGLGFIGAYLALDVMEKSRKRTFILVTIVLMTITGICCGVLVEHATAVSDGKKDGENAELKQKVEKVSEGNDTLLKALVRTTPLTPAERMQKIEESLRSEYITSTKTADPLIVAGKAYPPADWMNARLRELGENWTFSSQELGINARPHDARSYLILDPSRLQTAGQSHPGWFVAGDNIAFNFFTTVTGQNPLQVRNMDGRVLFPQDAADAESMYKQFLAKYAKEERANLSHERSSTLSPATASSEFFTLTTAGIGIPGAAFTEPLIADLQAGRKVVLFVAVASYEDQGKLHHARMCSIMPFEGSGPRIVHACPFSVISD